MTHVLRTLAVPTALAAVLALTACGGSPAAPSATGTPTASGAPSPTMTLTVPSPGSSPVGPPIAGPANGDDVIFSNTTLFYHVYGQAMADLARKHGTDAKVKAFALKMKTAQAPEITQMAGWMVGGKLPVPTLKGGVVTGHSMPGMGGETTQMMDNKDITALGKVAGPAFDRQWLQMMIKHHEGALVTAQAELKNGLNTLAKGIAQSVIDRHTAEIATMKSTLAGISG